MLHFSSSSDHLTRVLSARTSWPPSGRVSRVRSYCYTPLQNGVIDPTAYLAWRRSNELPPCADYHRNDQQDGRLTTTRADTAFFVPCFEHFQIRMKGIRGEDQICSIVSRYFSGVFWRFGAVDYGLGRLRLDSSEFEISCFLN